MLLQHGTPALMLAPMEGVTDAPMRALLTEIGGFSWCVAEFLRVSQDIPSVKAFLRHVPELAQGARTPAAVGVQVQLLGGDPDKLARSAQVAVAAGAAAIDLNFGCPARTVNRHDGGATLLKHPERIYSIVHAVRGAVPAHIPVSAKLRLGWDDPMAVHRNSEMAVKGGAAWITIHGRTRDQGYKPPAYWGPIGAVRRQVDVPVVANGEIWTVDDFERCRDETGCEHFMLGRGALADPTLPRRVAHRLGLDASVEEERRENFDWCHAVTRFVALTDTTNRRDGYLPGRIKQWGKMSHQRFGTPWYLSLKTLGDVATMLDALGETERALSAVLFDETLVG